jgi:hypothetical protein
MLSRQEVFDIIEDERAYQDKTYNPAQVLSSGQTREQRDLDVTSGLVMLDTYLHKAKDAWTGQTGSSLASIQQIAKIAAIATRILERAGGTEELLTKGLR